MDNEKFPLPGQSVGIPSVDPTLQPGVTDTTEVNMQSGKTMMPNVPMGQIASNATTAVVSHEKDISGLIKTILLVILSLVSVTFIGLFIWMNTRYNEVNDDVQGQISEAVAEAKYEQATQLEEEFAEREKDPYRTFTGPVDYGQVSFKYPKTWSVYVEADAANGGDFKAYFNPIQVDAVSKDTVNALRLTILDDTFESVVSSYQRYLDKEELSIESITVSGVSANLYTGTIPKTEMYGCIVIFKIRDKTAVFQTDSILFKEDFDKVLSTVTFNA